MGLFLGWPVRLEDLTVSAAGLPSRWW